ncbi:CHASE3 domain-containing protein [Geodermatophilus sp. SYSU D00703]
MPAGAPERTRRADPGPGRFALRSRVSTLRGTVQLVVLVMVALLLTGGTVAGLARLSVLMSVNRLEGTVLPARQAATDLTVAFVDQETGQRGYLLTGDHTFLEPYDRGRADAESLEVRLTELLRDDATGLDLLRQVTAAAQSWDEQVAQPQIAARSLGAVPDDVQRDLDTTGKALFDTLRERSDALTARTAQLTRVQLDHIAAAQAVANGVSIGALVVALTVALLTVPLLRRRLTRPLERLLTDVQAVAAGDHDRPISAQGAQELVTIAASVETMRQSVLRHSRERLAAQRQLTLHEEHDRMATDLHDLTIQRVFALGLRLSSAGRRHPELAPVLAPLVEETDEVIRELRTVIFDLGRTPDGDHALRRSVLDVTETSVRVLGFSPVVEFGGPVDAVPAGEVVDGVTAVLRESLSNVARHAGASTATVRIAVHDGSLALTVTDDGRGIPDGAPRGNGLANLRTRAERLGGRATVDARPDGRGTVIRWEVPLPGDPSPP